MRAAVVGHVEWIEFARVDHVPAPGEIIHADKVWEEPGGGGSVAAVQLAKLTGDAVFFTALGDDELGHRAHRALTELGLRVEAAFRPEPQRRGFVYVDNAGERTITVIGDRLGPRSEDPLPWDELRHVDALYLTAGDAGAVQAARAAHALVSTPRGLDTLQQAHVKLDALVSSGRDVGERYTPGDLDPPPRLVVRTAGASGGNWEREDGATGSWEPAPLPGPVRDAYGCGDSFAAGLTYGLGEGLSPDEAVRIGARCGAWCLTGHGPYAGQLTAADLTA
jgi:ribokinase